MINMNTRQWSTPAIIASGVFMSVSGVLMFFGVHDPVKLAHEWIGLAFVTFVVLHSATHWQRFKAYFSQRMAVVVIAAVAVVTGSLMVASGAGEGGDVHHRMFRTFERAPLTEVAPLLDQTAEGLSAKIQAGGFKVASTAQSIEEIASRNGTHAPEVLHLVFE